MHKKFSLIGSITILIIFVIIGGILKVRPTFLSDAFSIFLAVTFWLLGIAMSFGAWIGSFFPA